MNTKRSYIESLNAGRQRREQSSLEDLNRSLASLDERFGRGPREDEENGPATGARPPSGEASRWSEADSREGRPARDFAGDFQRNRTEQSGVASMGRIALELNSLRE